VIAGHPVKTKQCKDPVGFPAGSFLYIENHWLGQWFKKAYGDEEKTLLESRSSPPTEPRN
jgi:hypothetical protein